MCTCTEKYEGVTCGNKGLFVDVIRHTYAVAFLKSTAVIFLISRCLRDSLYLKFILYIMLKIRKVCLIISMNGLPYGQTILFSVDPCEINPCLNGGECMSDLSEFTTSCTCPDGYEGDTCQNRGKIMTHKTVPALNFGSIFKNFVNRF
jgi:hypothetical protein